MGGVRGKTGRRCNLYSSRRGRDSQSWRVRLSEQQQAKGKINNNTRKKHLLLLFHHSALQTHPPFRLKRATGAPKSRRFCYHYLSTFRPDNLSFPPSIVASIHIPISTLTSLDGSTSIPLKPNSIQISQDDWRQIRRQGQRQQDLTIVSFSLPPGSIAHLDLVHEASSQK